MLRTVLSKSMIPCRFWGARLIKFHRYLANSIWKLIQKKWSREVHKFKIINDFMKFNIKIPAFRFFWKCQIVLKLFENTLK